MSTSTEDCPLRVALASLASRTSELLESFYVRLEEHDPALKARLCSAEPERRRAILLNVIVLVAETHEEPDAVSETLRRLGQRHRQSGIRREDVKAFGAALREALAEVLGELWTPSADWLWRRSFRRVTEEMG